MGAVLCAGLGSAAIVDATERRIPNVISLGTASAGVMLAAMRLSGISVTSSLIGLAIGFALMLPGHLFGGTGAGDVKLFAAAGAVLGAQKILPAFLLVVIAGGALAIAIAWRRGRLARTLTRTARLCGRPVEGRAGIEAPDEHNRFAYGPAIAAGCVAAALL